MKPRPFPVSATSHLVVLFLLIFVFTHSSLMGQRQKVQLTGSVRDSVSSLPMGYASISVFSGAEKKLVTGNITSDDGSFRLELAEGRFYAEISFVGYRTKTTPAFTVSDETKEITLGTILLSPDHDVLDEVVVRGEKSTMELSLDKRVFNVGKDLANNGGSASDILMNIPSVAVDPEGNIRLRGSDNVRILIDGKPSGLVSFKGGSGLQQLQANMVERVEVITNPSARYEAEGTGGIINIILKKEKNQGLNGSADVITGYPSNYGLAANINYRKKKVNFFVNYGIAFRSIPGRGTLYQESFDDNSVAILRQTNTWRVRGLNNNIRGGIDFYFSEKSILTGSYLYRRSDYNRLTDIFYLDYLGNPSNLTGYSTRRQDEDEKEPNSEYSIIHKKMFEGKGHELLTEVKFLDNREDSDQTFTEYYFFPNGTEDPARDALERSVNVESEKQLLLQIDYTRPLGKEGKFETGFRSSFREMKNDFVVTRLTDGGDFEPIPGFDNIFLYDEYISALYGILGNRSKWFTYQAGLRAEWTDVNTILVETNEKNPRRYYNIFPSAHFTFELPSQQSIQVSYSRRIRRPFYNDLSPFVTYSDDRNIFNGNPDLEPEFSNVMELGHIKQFDAGTLSTSLFTRLTRDKIDNIRSVSNGTSLTITENLRAENAYGLDVATTLEINRWWKWDGNANVFYAEIDGSNIETDYKTTTFSWFARQTSRFLLPAKIEMQLRTNYEAPVKTAQGSRRALYYADFSIAKDILKGNGTINLSVLDVFNTRRIRSTFSGETFYTERDFQNRRRQLNIIFNYRIKRSKSAGRQKREETVVE